MRRVVAAAAFAVLASAADRAGDTAGRDGMLSEAHKALRKGLHHKAYEHYRSAWRTSPHTAFDHPELQEGLCVCAAKLKKERVAITACENASAIRAKSDLPPPPLHLHMAQGEAALFDNKPAVAREHFRLAAEAAAKGEALRQEKEARDAIKRAEGQFYASFSRQRAKCTSPEIRRKAFTTIADALAECASERKCAAVSAQYLSLTKLEAAQRSGRPYTFIATLHNGTSVSSDLHEPPSSRSVVFRRDAPTHAYALKPSSTLDRKVHPRAAPGAVAPAAAAVLMHIQRAIALCDAQASAVEEGSAAGKRSAACRRPTATRRPRR